MFLRVIIFLVLNFGALGLGGLLMGGGPMADWYQNLDKAPWTPPSWVFGAAWTTIMVTFAFYMSVGMKKVNEVKPFIILYIIQLVLNISWNPAFFNFHEVLVALVVIVSLALVLGYFVFGYMKQLKWQVLWAFPYFIWLLIAASLNAYILVNN